MNILEDEKIKEVQEEKIVKLPKRKPYIVWTVGDKDYKLKLTTSAIVELESRSKTNLLNLLDGIPQLSVMLAIAKGALQKFHHGITNETVKNMFDIYCDENEGSQIEFLTNIIMPLFEASGFFSVKQGQKMTEQLVEAQEQM